MFWISFISRNVGSHEAPGMMTFERKGSKLYNLILTLNLIQLKFIVFYLAGLFGGAVKRSKQEELPDMNVKPDDPPLISSILTTALPDFDTFVNSMPLDKATRLYQFSLSQKQGDRILTAFMNEVPAKAQLEEQIIKLIKNY